MPKKKKEEKVHSNISLEESNSFYGNGRITSSYKIVKYDELGIEEDNLILSPEDLAHVYGTLERFLRGEKTHGN